MGTSTSRHLPTVDNVDLPRYMGRWWQHAFTPASRFGLSFQDPNPTAVMAVYELAPPGSNGVLFTVANTEWVAHSRRVNTAKARAMAVLGSKEAGKLRVQFSMIDGQEGSYWILMLGDAADDQPYPWAVVGSDNEDYLWFLERSPGIITAQLFERLVQRLINEFGYPRSIVTRLRLTPPNADIVRHVEVDGDPPSRAWPRGNDETVDEFNTLLNARQKWARFQRSLGE
jgi:apolipoprotein D and lipocalin family protein